METTFERERTNVGDGWQPIIERANTDLIDLLGDYQLLQIKEKFGGLRYYMQAPSGCDITLVDKIRDIITEAEDASTTTCETCGKPGELRHDLGWLKTLCDPHHDEALAARKAWMGG